MITRIYALPNCYKCAQAIKLFPEAQLIYINILPEEEKEDILKKAKKVGQISAPILMDSDENIITHEEAGL